MWLHLYTWDLTSTSTVRMTQNWISMIFGPSFVYSMINQDTLRALQIKLVFWFLCSISVHDKSSNLHGWGKNSAVCILLIYNVSNVFIRRNEIKDTLGLKFTYLCFLIPGKPHKSFFSVPATKRGGGKGRSTKKKEHLLKLFFPPIDNNTYFTLTILQSC